jgi:hypothetical protein
MIWNWVSAMRLSAWATAAMSWPRWPSMLAASRSRAFRRVIGTRFF